MGFHEPVHIKAKKGDIAERVIAAGDPARVKQLAGYLENPRLVNENRGYLTYTGLYNGVPVTVATHGIGAPSAAIVFEELHMLGAKAIIRLGTCGALVKGLKIGDYIVATGAAYPHGGATLGMYVPEACMATAPDFELTRLIVEELEKMGEKATLGPVFSSDAFYAEDPEFAKRWGSRGVVCVEMEVATLFALGLMRGFKTAAILMVSDSLVEPSGFADARELAPRVDRISRIVFNAITRLKL